ncbi:hypothetical protein K431DRAFT_241630 [Polychaeton citri CBS 116435]|uniref:Ribosomal protein/NADH dehydrogenase domain-containing protein n=1 Tax=Polychaeton citri CBS 116435 TaxID=1314669 RepID=A0A9P4QE80_9PEZI|nr:hypothetical protein K431DRAFT_241630 [Polychaeton citri CBS 116435]
MSLAQRMRALQSRLLAIRLGSGAYVLPKDIKRIHLTFAQKINGGHAGPRHFWREELVRLKYHNPAVSMTVARHQQPEGPATLSVHYASPDAAQTSSSATSSPASTASTAAGSTPSSANPTEKVETIDMKFKPNSEILTELVRLTKAYPVEPTPEDREQIQALEEQKKRSERDSKLSQEVRARKKREQEMLEQARGEIAAQSS